MSIESTGKCVCHINGYEIKDSNSRLRLDALLTYIYNEFDFITIDDFKTSSAIDLTQDDGSDVVTNYYDDKKHQIVIPTGEVKTIRCTPVSIEHNVRKIFVHADTCGTGSIACYISYNGGSTFESVEQDSVIANHDNGTSLVMKLVLTGDITLKSIYWGGAY